ncbi:aldo/keto reductase [Lacisediminihabitans changchengi]|nr:aldo/keto reductase [Lacisediminihabitans changchengi]
MPVPNVAPPAYQPSETMTPAPLALRRRLGQSDLRVFPLALGGNVFGWTADGQTTDEILDTYADHGGNFIDTADSYAGGRSEIMIGNWMRSRGNRDRIVVATKVGKGPENSGVTAQAVSRAVNDSLRRLGTDHIDLLYLHIDDTAVPFEETLFAVDDLVRMGKVRYFGAADHTGDRLIEARVIAAQLGVTPMVAVQQHYNLVHRRSFEADIARVAAQQQLGVMPRFALASGFLTGKYRTRADVARNSRGADAGRYLSRRGLRVLACLDAIVAEQRAQGIEVATVAAVSLAWLLTKRNVVAPVASASHAAQVLDLMASATIQLSRHQLAALDRASA